MFTVIIPLFNKLPHIEKCLNSVLAQSFTDYEIIIVNDGSTDGGEEVVRKVIAQYEHKVQRSPFNVQSIGFEEIPGYVEYKQSETRNQKPEIRISLITQSNSGVSTARNNGVKHAQYDYIAFLDADDWWEPDFLKKMMSLILKYPEAGIYGSSYNIIKNGTKKKANIGLPDDFKIGVIDYLSTYAATLCMPLWTGATVLKKSVFESEGSFKPNLKLGEDFDLWIRIALKYPVAFLNKPLSYYNQDIPLPFRAVGNLFEPKHHFLWHLELLAGEEAKNSELKQLLDKIRVYALFPYYLEPKYRSVARTELRKIEWSKQSCCDRLKYSLPVFVIKGWWFYRLVGSFIKQKLIRFVS